MRRTLLVYLLLVLLPALALAMLAFRVADWDHEERLKAEATRLDDEAAALARRVEAALSDSVERSKTDPVVAFAAENRWQGYARTPAATGEAFSPDDLKHYNLSRRGGESYEHRLHDPARALDVYAFYVARIRSPVLRARLRFHCARAALAAGREALGKELLREIFTQAGATDAASDEGLPLDLLAATRLLAIAPPVSDDALGEAARGRLRQKTPLLSTPQLELFAAALASEDAELRDLITKRRALEAAVAAHPAILAGADAVLTGASLLLAEPVDPDASGAALRAIRLARVDLPALAVGDLTATLESTGSGQATGTRPVRLGQNGPIVAFLRLEDPHASERLAAIDQRRTIHRALIGLLLAVTLSGGVALVSYISRERRLALLRSRLLANVSHELKTPATSIRVFAEMLAREPLGSERARRSSGLLRAESLRLSGLVENLLDFSRRGPKDEEIATEPVDLAALLRQIAAAFAVRAEEEGVDFRLEGLALPGQNGAEVLVQTSAPAVERVIANLLDNALKYRRAEGPAIRLALETARGGAGVRIAVADNGPGIPRRDRERIFEEFYRVRYEDYAVQGSGLGLAIARRTARGLGGDITVESREGEGSTFTVELPLKAVEHDKGAHPAR